MAQHYAKRLDEKKRQSQKPAKGEWSVRSNETYVLLFANEWRPLSRRVHEN